MCEEMEQAHMSVPLSFPLLVEFLMLVLFLFHKCEPGLRRKPKKVTRRHKGGRGVSIGPLPSTFVTIHSIG